MTPGREVQKDGSRRGGVSLRPSAQAVSSDAGCSQSNVFPPTPEGFSDADIATPPLKLKQTGTDKWTSGVNGWCRSESWTGSDLHFDRKLKEAVIQNVLPPPF